MEPARRRPFLDRRASRIGAAREGARVIARARSRRGLDSGERRGRARSDGRVRDRGRTADRSGELVLAGPRRRGRRGHPLDAALRRLAHATQLLKVTGGRLCSTSRTKLGVLLPHHVGVVARSRSLAPASAPPGSGARKASTARPATFTVRPASIHRSVRGPVRAMATPRRDVHVPQRRRHEALREVRSDEPLQRSLEHRSLTITSRPTPSRRPRGRRGVAHPEGRSRA